MDRLRSTSVAALLLFATFGAFADTASAQQTLPVPNVSQLPQTNWCWAATSEAVLRYTGNAPGMCTVADFARQQNGWGNDNCCVNGTGAICNQPNWLWGHAGSMEAIFANWGALSTRYGRSLTLREVQDAIDDDRPIIVRWGWTNGGGHFVVLDGYSGSTMTIMDPWNGPTTLSHGNLTSTAARAWTHSLTVDPRKVTYVVDDTGSMFDEIDSVKSTLVAQAMGYQSAGTFVKYALITYKDSVDYRGSTTDHSEIIDWINALGASGGGDCPEEGYGALDTAAQEAPESDVWWMTDADSHGGILRLLLTRFRLLLAGNTLHSTILGSCSSLAGAGQGASASYDPATYGPPHATVGTGGDVNAFEAGEELSTATGGLFFAVASDDIAEATEIVVEEISSSALVRRLALPGGSHATAVPVDASLATLRITLDVRAGATGVIGVADPSGAPLVPGSAGVDEIVAGASRMLIVAPPALTVGEYTVSTSSDAEYFLSVSGESPHFVELFGDTTTGVDRTLPLRVSIESLGPPTGPGGPGDAGPGGPLDPVTAAEPVLPFEPETLAFFLEGEDGAGRSFIDLFDDGLHGDGEAGDGVFGGEALFGAAGRFRLGVTDFGFFERVARQIVAVADVAVSGDADAVEAPGSILTHVFTVENLASTSRTFQIGAASSAGWADLGSVPPSVVLGAAGSVDIPVQVTIPAGAARGEVSVLSLTALAADDPAIFDDASVTTTAWEGPLLQSLDSTVVSPGEHLVLIGSGFGDDPGVGNRSTDFDNVTLAGVRVPDPDVLEWSPTAITIRVPVSAASGLVFLVADGIDSNALELTVLGGGAGGPSLLEIPTLSGYGIALLILLLMAAGTLVLRRSSG